jgi:hypothetical protein
MSPNIREDPRIQCRNSVGEALNEGSDLYEEREKSMWYDRAVKVSEMCAVSERCRANRQLHGRRRFRDWSCIYD